MCDADYIVHRLLAENRDVIKAVIERFCRNVLDAAESVDLRLLGSIVFNDQSRLAELNMIVHPVVKGEIDAWLQRVEVAGVDTAAVIVPLLFEAGMQDGWDAVICVTCPERVQLERLVGRGLSEMDARKRIAAQMPVSEKAARSDCVISNAGSMEEFYGAIDRILMRYGSKAR